MITEAIDRLLELGEVEELDIAGRTYTSKQIHAVREPAPEGINVTTLAGFVDLVNANIEHFKDEDVLVHVVSYQNAVLVGKYSDTWGRRQSYITAKLQETEGFSFGRFHDHENFVIGIQSNFTDAGDREYVLKLASNITADMVRTSTDDGVSQEVGMRAGVALKATEAVRSRVSLAPYRTFREVDQPLSEFVLRVKQNGQAMPQLALFEADGGKWKLDAIENVARYLRSAIKNITVVS